MRPLVPPLGNFSAFARLTSAATVALGLSSCATPFAPYAGEDAGRLRLRLATDAVFVRVTPYLQSVTGGQCGPRIVVPSLEPPRTDTIARREDAAGRGLPSAYPRADMHDSTDPSRTDAAELRLAAGRYMVTMLGNYAGVSCILAGTLDVAARQQYDMDFTFAPGKCLSTLRRLEAPLGPQGRLQWTRQAFEAPQPCSKN
jgi:hypothetical protein